MSKKKENAPGETPAEEAGTGSAGLMGNAGAGDEQSPAPPFSFGPGNLTDEPPALHSRDLVEAEPEPAPSLPRFRVRFDLSSPIGTPEAVYHAEDEASAIAAHRRFNGLGSTINGTITCTRED